MEVINMTIMSVIKSMVIAVLTLVFGLFFGFCAGIIVTADYYEKNNAIESETE